MFNNNKYWRLSLKLVPEINADDCKETPFQKYFIKKINLWVIINISLFIYLQRPPSSSLSYGAMNDDVRSPGSGSTPGPLSAQGPPGLDTSDPGKFPFLFHL